MGLLNELEEIKRQERASKKNLQKLKRNFYEDTVKRIEELRMEARVYMEKMDIESAGKIMNEIKKIEKALDEIISLRTRKILLSTLWKNEREVKNLTPEEEILYKEVKDSLTRHKNAIYKRDVSPLQEKKEKEKKKEEIEKVEYVLARVKVPSMRIALPDGNLFIKKEDVLHLPKKIFNILLKNDAVEEVKIGAE